MKSKVGMHNSERRIMIALAVVLGISMGLAFPSLGNLGTAAQLGSDLLQTFRQPAFAVAAWSLAQIGPPVTSTALVCSPDTINVGATTTCTAVVTGHTPTGIVFWSSNSSSGLFNSTNCALSFGSCSVNYTEATVVSVNVTANYAGDMNNAGSWGRFVVIVQPATVQVTVTSTPSGAGLITVDGVQFVAPQTFSWTRNSTHTVGVTSPVSGGSGIQYVFNSWSDGGSMTHQFTVPSSPTTITVSYLTQYLLTMQTNASGGGSVTPTSEWQNAGTNVTIKGIPTTGWAFQAWQGSGSGSYTGTDNPASVTINGPITETALFSNPIPEYPGGGLVVVLALSAGLGMLFSRRLAPQHKGDPSAGVSCETA